MNNGIKREEFSLKKVKILKGGGLDTETTITTSIDSSMMEIDRTQKTPVIPAPELETAIRDLKEKLLKSCGFLLMQTLVNSSEFKPRNDQKEAVEKAIDLLKERTVVTGVHISGSDNTEGVIISGKIKAENGGNVAINSPRMRFKVSTFGFEEELETECHAIESHVYEYLHKGKKAQLDVFTDEEQGTKGPEVEETDIDAVNEKKAEAEKEEVKDGEEKTE